MDEGTERKNEVEPPDELPEDPGIHWSFLLKRNRLAFLWTTSVVIGAFLISITDQLNLVRSIVPILIMLGYVWYGLQISRKNTQRFADSVYFLGFLWTLWALIDALLLRQKTTTAGGVFLAFGYALITTATGMFMRLFIVQFNYTIPDQLMDARKEIEQDLYEFSKAIRTNVEELQQLHSRTSAALDQWINGIGQMTSAFQRAVQDSYLKVADSIAGEMAKVLEDMTENSKTLSSSVVSLGKETATIATELRSTATRIKNASEKLDASLQLVTNGVDGFSERVAAVEVPSDLLSRKLDTIIADLNAEAGRLGRGIMKTADIIGDRIPALMEHLKTLPNKEDFDHVFGEYSRFLNDLARGCGEIVARTENLSSSVNNALATVTLIGQTAEKTNETIGVAHVNGKRYAEVTERAAREFQESRAKLDTTITEVVQFIDNRLQEKL